MEPSVEHPLRTPHHRALLRFAQAGAAALTRYHRARLLGVEHVPDGPALLVGNHGVYGYETPIFFYLLLRATGRYPVGMADRGFYRLPVVRDLLRGLGGLEGRREHAIAALRHGHLVVVYPGGAREVFKRPSARYRLRWQRTVGFARVAAEAQVPVLPFAAQGPDDAFAFSGDPRLGVRLSRLRDRYTVPLGLPLPLPVRLRFRIGRPLAPPPRGAPPEVLARFRDQVARRVRRLLVRTSLQEGPAHV